MKVKAIMFIASIAMISIGGAAIWETAIVNKYRITARLINSDIKVGMAKDALIKMLKNDACGGGEINWQNIGDVNSQQCEILYYKHHYKWTEGYTISIRNDAVKSIHVGVFHRGIIARELLKQDWKYIQESIWGFRNHKTT